MERRNIFSGALVAAGMLLGSRFCGWAYEQLLDAAKEKAVAVNWSEFPWRDAASLALVLGGFLFWMWPSIVRWAKSPTAKQRHDKLVDTLVDDLSNIEVNHNEIKRKVTSQQQQIDEISARLSKIC